jgi:hypothetical protein
MRWTVTLVAEVEPGQRIEHEIVAVDRDDRITPATLGLSIAEGKAVLAAIQARVVVDDLIVRAYHNYRRPRIGRKSIEGELASHNGVSAARRLEAECVVRRDGCRGRI